MPVTYKQIAAKTASVTLRFGEDTITVVYYPNKFTDALVAQIQAGTLTDSDLFTELIKEWDIYEDDEHTVMFPIERVNEFGLQFKNQLGTAIGEDIRPNVPTPQMKTLN